MVVLLKWVGLRDNSLTTEENLGFMFCSFFWFVNHPFNSSPPESQGIWKKLQEDLAIYMLLVLDWFRYHSWSWSAGLNWSESWGMNSSTLKLGAKQPLFTLYSCPRLIQISGEKMTVTSTFNIELEPCSSQIHKKFCGVPGSAWNSCWLCNLEENLSFHHASCWLTASLVIISLRWWPASLRMISLQWRWERRLGSSVERDVAFWSDDTGVIYDVFERVRFVEVEEDNDSLFFLILCSRRNR